MIVATNSNQNLIDFSTMGNSKKISSVSDALPHSDEAEDGLINLMIHYPECFYEVDESGITKEFYYNHEAAYMHELIFALVEEGGGQHPTPYNIICRLKAETNKDYYTYYNRVMPEVCPKEWVGSYLKKLVNTYKKRLEAELYLEGYKRAFDTSIEADNSLASTIKRAEQIEQLTNPLDMFSMARLEKLLRNDYEQAPTRPRGATWGISSLDNFTGGLRFGENSLLFAKPGLGKTSLLWQACWERSMLTDRWQLWITLGDMTTPQLFRRGMQQQTGLSSISQMQGRYVGKDGFDRWDEIDHNLKALKKRKLIICEPEQFYTSDLRRTIKRVLRQVPTVDVYIDHVGLFSDKCDDINVMTSNIATALLSCGHHIKDSKGNNIVSITAVSPINKSGEYKGSTALGHAAENIYSLDRARVQDGGADFTKDPSDQSGYVNFSMLKNRHGGAGTVKLWFEASKALFMDKPNDYKMM